MQSSQEEQAGSEPMHKRIVVKEDGRKLYSYTFGSEPDPFDEDRGQPAAASAQPAVEHTGHV